MSSPIFQAALAAHLEGQLEEALKLYQKVIEIDNYNSDAFANLGNIHMQLNNKQEALSLTLKAQKINPSQPMYSMNIGAIYLELDDLKSAATYTKESLKLDPNNPTALTNLAIIYNKLGRSNDALNPAIQALNLAPNSIQSLLAIASISNNLGDKKSAVSYLKKCLQIDNKNQEALRSLGLVYRELDKPEEAIRVFKKCLNSNPNNTSILNIIGLIELEKGSPDWALKVLNKSLDINPDNPNTLQLLGEAFIELELPSQAIDVAQKSYKLNPNDASTCCTLAKANARAGNIKKSKKLFYKSLDIDPYFAQSACGLCENINTRNEASKLLQALKLIQGKNTSKVQAPILELAASNCYHKLADYHKAQLHLEKSNQLKYSKDKSEYLKITSEIEYFLSRKEDSHNNNQHGVNFAFIIGMPRSGSTLLEAMLGTNDLIKTVGEPNAMEKTVYETISNEHKTTDIAELYAQKLGLNPQENRLTVDKQLYNFRYAGFIASHLSSSKLIHMRRNPLDNILSIYRSGLRTTYTSNIEEASKVMILQERAMTEYKKTHPNRIYTLSYENLVTSAKETLSALIEWLGLKWDESYLHPERNKTPISTASLYQARKPINKSAVNRWKNYAPMLEPARALFKDSKLFNDFDLDIHNSSE